MKLEQLRSIVRPVVTLEFSFLVMAMFWCGKPIPQLLQWTWLIVLCEYFGERLLLKLIGK